MSHRRSPIAVLWFWLLVVVLCGASRCTSERDATSPVQVSLIVEHGLISVAGWLLGLTVGGISGYGIAVLVRRFSVEKPVLGRLIQLIPWRTVLMMLFLLLLLPIFIVVQVGLGVRAGIISVGTSMFLLTLTFTTTTLLNYWNDTPVGVRFISWARTLVTAAVVIEFLIGPYGGGGVGFAVVQCIRILDQQAALKYIESLVVIILLLDLLLGGVQYYVVARAAKGSAEVDPGQ